MKPEKPARRCVEMTSIGKRIELLRDARGLTQVDLAKAAGLKQNSISRYESGKQKPSREAVAALAQFFGVHPAAIEYGALPAMPDGPMSPVLSAFLGTLEGRNATPEEVIKLRAADAAVCLETPIACHYALQAIRQRQS